MTTTRLLCGCLLLMLAVGVAGGKEKAPFNGKDLTGWEGDSRLWSVEEGAIVGRTTSEEPIKNNTFLVWKDGKLTDFRLTLEFKIEGGNSGIQYRSKVIDPEKWIVGGYQADIDSGPKYTGILYEERGRGILTERGQRTTIDRDGKAEKGTFAEAAELQKVIKDGEWNLYEIEARGPRLKHTINGKLMSETTDRDRKHRAKSGVLALQLHAGPPMTVQFRKLRLEELQPKEQRAKAK